MIHKNEISVEGPTGPLSAYKGDRLVGHQTNAGGLTSNTALGVRYGFATVAAAGLTLVLGLAMSALIAAEFTASESVKGLDFAVNAVADDLPPPPARKRPEALDPVDVPPATPRIATRDNVSVIVEPVPIGDVYVDWKPPVLRRTDFIINAGDRDVQPVLRPAPAMPPRADRSGHCVMAFDVTAEGAPFNIQAIRCSDTVFARASVKAVARWRYNPRIIDGQAVSMRGLRNQITFRLIDERGQVIPE